MYEIDFSRPAPRVRNLEEAQALIDQLWALLREQARQLGEQARRIEQLEEAVGVDSRTSSKPPSSDSAAARAQRKKKQRSGRSKGGQPGHPKHERALVEEVDRVEHYYPPGACVCGAAVVMEPEPRHRHQVFDLPQVRYTVTEHRVYEGRCPQCRRRVQGALPQAVPRGQMGPGLVSEIALLNSQYRLSLRQIQQYLQARWGLRFSLGAISQAQRPLPEWLSPVYGQIGQWVRSQGQAHADETTHYHHGTRFWLWTLCTAQAAYFLIHFSRGKLVARELLGTFDGALVTDRYGGYCDYARRRRQLCWAHVIRNLERMARRQGRAGELGRRLVRLAQLVIRVVHHHRRGYLGHARHRQRLKRLRRAFRQSLQQGACSERQPRTRGQCRALLKDEPMLWTFLRYPELPLTNNCAERALRPFVIWRKTSFFSQSVRGLQFRPMMLSVVATAERLGVNTYDLLRQICTEGLRGEPITARLPLPGPARLTTA